MFETSSSVDRLWKQKRNLVVMRLQERDPQTEVPTQRRGGWRPRVTEPELPARCRRGSRGLARRKTFAYGVSTVLAQSRLLWTGNPSPGL